MTLQASIMFALAVLLIGLSKGGLGGPVPVSLTTPLLSLFLPVSLAVGVILPMLIFADWFAIYFYWRQWEMRYVRLLLPASVFGVIMGTLLLANLPNDALKRIIGGFTLAAVIYKICSEQLAALAYQPRSWHGHLAGWASGFGASLANAGAPPFTAYMLLQPGMTPMTFIGTTTLFFAVVNMLKLPTFLTSGVLDLKTLWSVTWAAPLIPFGVWAARRVIAHINPRQFEYLMLFLLTVLGLVMLFA